MTTLLELDFCLRTYDQSTLDARRKWNLLLQMEVFTPDNIKGFARKVTCWRPVWIGPKFLATPGWTTMTMVVTTQDAGLLHKANDQKKPCMGRAVFAQQVILKGVRRTRVSFH